MCRLICMWTRSPIPAVVVLAACVGVTVGYKSQPTAARTAKQDLDPTAAIMSGADAVSADDWRPNWWIVTPRITEMGSDGEKISASDMGEGPDLLTARNAALTSATTDLKKRLG